MRRPCLLALALLVLACGAAGPGSSRRTSSSRNTGKPIDPPASERPPDPLEPKDSSAPALAGPACRGPSDCQSGLECFSPDFKPGRGTPPPCSSDAPCGKGRICEDDGCKPACTDKSCPKGHDCEEDGHCRIRSCRAETKPTICARNHRCGQDGLCSRMQCAKDNDCDIGACVMGSCYGKPGSCMPHDVCCPP